MLMAATNNWSLCAAYTSVQQAAPSFIAIVSFRLPTLAGRGLNQMMQPTDLIMPESGQKLRPVRTGARRIVATSIYD
jgi:hypothetical protein